MPSQEPQLDDKNDEVDLPSEETDGRECFLVKLEFVCFPIWRPSFYSTCLFFYEVYFGLSLV